MTMYEVVQRSPEWVALRLGRVTSSVAAEMQASRRDGKEAAGRRNLRVRLMLERLTGRSQENGFVSRAMEQGIAREADASALYEALTGQIVQTTGFVAHDTLLAGCSPDGYLNDWEGLVEAKCPLPATHLTYLQTGAIPGDYRLQITHQLWITGARWCDWLSYGPEFPEPLQVKLVRVVRDEGEMVAYGGLVRQFLKEVDRELEAVQALMAAIGPRGHEGLCDHGTDPQRSVADPQ